MNKKIIAIATMAAIACTNIPVWAFSPEDLQKEFQKSTKKIEQQSTQDSAKQKENLKMPDLDTGKMKGVSESPMDVFQKQYGTTKPFATPTAKELPDNLDQQKNDLYNSGTAALENQKETSAKNLQTKINTPLQILGGNLSGVLSMYKGRVGGLNTAWVNGNAGPAGYGSVAGMANSVTAGAEKYRGEEARYKKGVDAAAQEVQNTGDYSGSGRIDPTKASAESWADFQKDEQKSGKSKHFYENGITNVLAVGGTVGDTILHGVGSVCKIVTGKTPSWDVEGQIKEYQGGSKRSIIRKTYQKMNANIWNHISGK